MGCTNSTLTSIKVESCIGVKSILAPFKDINPQTEKDIYTKSQIINSIRRRDIILLQKAIQQHQGNITALLSCSEEYRGVFHLMAEYNFAQGMSLLLSILFTINPNEVSTILNLQDDEGNTCLTLCCVYESTQTLTVIMKSGQADCTIRNHFGQTALDIALEKESICAKLLSLYLTQHTCRTLSNNGSPVKSAENLNLSQTSQRSTKLEFSEKKDDMNSLQGSPLMYFNELDRPLDHNDLMLSFNSDGSKATPLTRLNHIMNSLKDVDAIFNDEEFPHEYYSIVYDEHFTRYFQRPLEVSWLRAHELMKIEPEDVKLFELIEMPDVSKSPIFGCDFYYALALLREFPQRITRVFTNKETNIHGVCSVEYLVCGIPIEIVLDDSFPCVNGEALFSKTNSNELWFLLLEKAAAKLYGNYTEIDEVDITEALELVSGMPSYQKDLKSMSEEKLWDLLVDSNERNYMTCVGTSCYEQSIKRNKNFGIIDVIEVGDSRLVKLKSFYNDKEMLQQLNKKVETWNKEFKIVIGYFEGESDCFYADVKELTEYFEFITVCYYHEEWQRKRVDVRAGPKETVFFELDVNEATEIIISVHQKLPRFVDEGSEYRISPVEVVLVEDQGDNYRYIGCGNEESLIGKSSIYVGGQETRLQLTQGKYLIRAKINWVDGLEHEFSLNTLSSLPVDLKISKQRKNIKFLEKAYTSLEQDFVEKSSFSHTCAFSSAWAGSHMWMCGVNDGDKVWNLEIVFDKMDNLKIPRKYRKDENSILIQVLPGQKCTAYIKRLTARGVSLKWRFIQSWQ